MAEAQPPVARGPGPPWLRALLVAPACLYLAAMVLQASGSALPRETLPRPALYFTQVACLFPYAAELAIEYRVQAFACDERKFRELDPRPYFPLRAGDKENRFQRLGFFYRRNRQVMEALDAHLVTRHNEQVAAGDDPRDGIEGRIGGIMFLSLRIPLPEPGQPAARYRRRPLPEIPAVQRKHWYKTPSEDLTARCAERDG